MNPSLEGNKRKYFFKFKIASFLPIITKQYEEYNQNPKSVDYILERHTAVRPL